MSFKIPQKIRLLKNEIISKNLSNAEFFNYVKNYLSKPFSALLLSGGNQDCSRYSIAVWDPFLCFKSKGQSLIIETPCEKRLLTGNPLSMLDNIFASLQPDFPLVCPPFSGGAVGYLAYELKNCIERLPQTAEDDLELPDLFLFFPKRILIHDQHEKTLRFLHLSCGEKDKVVVPGNYDDSEFHSNFLDAGKLESNFIYEDYLNAVRRIRHYIREGDIYQVNLSQRFSFPMKGNPFLFWQRLFDLNPAPFYAFINAGDHFVLCTSMERFLFQRESYIETRPIKGTRKRGEIPEEDKALVNDLKNSQKDDAELSMIVDLLRNDLGRVCKAKSIRVSEHKRVEAYQNVFHLISIIKGMLRPEITHGNLIQATFPGGSITGCPKIRSMEIIDELEPNVRHVYTGSIGYLGWHKNIDLNIAIRTAIYHKNRCYFNVGGGVIYDSKEDDEYQETIHKGRTFFQVVENLNKGV
ncbi:aminodeoxychorismate synthase [Candidatus Magnetomoraceae bacterium gMMP-15]